VPARTAPKQWAAFEEALKGVNLKMAGPWGPFGVPEGSSFMLKSKNADCARGKKKHQEET